MDNIAMIIEAAIRYTELVLSENPDYYEPAIRGLRGLRKTLSESIADHAALTQLDQYLIKVQEDHIPDFVDRRPEDA